jgi:hypothetical protein
MRKPRPIVKCGTISEDSKIASMVRFKPNA